MFGGSTFVHFWTMTLLISCLFMKKSAFSNELLFMYAANFI